MSKSSQFGKVPFKVIESGVVGSLKGSGAKVYLVILGHARRLGWTAQLSLDRIHCLTGLRRPTVCKAVGDLRLVGLIGVERGGGRTNTNVYHINSQLRATESEARKRSEQFGKVPFGVINSGVVGSLKGSAAKVYLVILPHMRAMDSTARLSLDRICRLTGLSRQTVCMAVADLERVGMIGVDRSGGRLNTNVYRIKSQLGATESEVQFREKQSTAGDPSRAGNSRLPCEKQSPPKVQTVAAGDKNRRLDLPPTERTKSNRAVQAAADVQTVEEPSRAALDALHDQGIDAPTDRMLVGEFPALTAPLIEEALSDLRSGAGPGLRVQRIRERMPGLLKRAAIRSRECSALQQRLAEIESRAVDKYRDMKPEIDEQLAALGKDELRNCSALARHRLIIEVGGGDEVRAVVDRWLRGFKDPFENGAFCWMLFEVETQRNAEARNGAERRNGAARAAPHREVEKRKEHETQENGPQPERLARERFDGLDDDAVCKLFRSFMKESSNKILSEKNPKTQAPAAADIRRYHRHDLIAFLLRKGLDASRTDRGLPDHPVARTTPGSPAPPVTSRSDGASLLPENGKGQA